MLIDNGAKPDEPHPDRKTTPLYIAAKHGHLECVKILVKYKANFNIKTPYGTPLKSARENKYHYVVSYLEGLGAVESS